MRFEDSIQDYGGQPITRQLLLNLLKDYKRPFDKISELVNQNKLIAIKRGVFIPGPALRMTGPEPFLLANHLYGPSYVTTETALSYWQMIPEKVYEISSATTGQSRHYDTSLGRFSYIHLPLPYYSFGMQQVRLAENQFALIAGPEKALCDKIILTAGLLFRSTASLRTWITEDMRMDKNLLVNLNTAMIGGWLKIAPKKNSLQVLIKTLELL